MTDKEHTEIVNELKEKYVGKYICVDNDEKHQIRDVYVDYRKDHQFMNRVVDEYGNVWFISSLEEDDLVD